MPEIAGYTNVVYIKGQYYGLAAAPMPSVFSGNIDEISEDLLAKTMLITRGSVGGTLPNDFGNTFLLTTVKYGTNTYLQTAYVVQTNYDCWEYRRIYSGSWTDWIGVDSSIKAVDDKIQSVKDTADGCSNSINTINNQLSSMSSSISNLSNSTIPALSNSVNAVGGRVTNLENKLALANVSGTYTVDKTSGAWNFKSVLAYKSGNTVSMYIQFEGNNSSVNVGNNAFVGKVTAGALPIMYARFMSYYGSSAIVADLTPSGDLTVRILGANLNIQRNTCSISSVFFVNG